MDDNYISLLWPENANLYASKTKKLNDTATENLDIVAFSKRLSENDDESEYIKTILTNLCCDENVIKYRQEVFKDIISSKNLISSLENVLDSLVSLSVLAGRSTMVNEVKLWALFDRYKELEGYSESILAIENALKNEELKSEGLIKLKKLIEDIVEDEKFKGFKKNLGELGIELTEIKSITVGINLDPSLEPTEATILSVNNTLFKQKDSVFKFILNCINNPTLNNEAGLSRMRGLRSTDSRHPGMNHFGHDIENLVTPIVKDLSQTLSRFTNINISFLMPLIPEIIFYLRAAKLYTYLKTNKMPVCIPKVLPIKDRECKIKDVYNVGLVIKLLDKNVDTSEKIILNNVRFDDDGRIFVLTGPNRGGKTVYTEAIGLSQVLFQSGLFVPGVEAAISPVDSIYTHFPVDENQTVNLGRLGEEAKRLSEIFSEVSSHSLVLLNESLASTSFNEAIYIAEDVLKSLRYFNVRALFNTHMHDLARQADTINNEIKGNSKVVSLVTGVEDGKRSYKIYKGEPLGKSYAKDIAEKYGMSFEQITSLRKEPVNTK